MIGATAMWMGWNPRSRADKVVLLLVVVFFWIGVAEVLGRLGIGQ